MPELENAEKKKEGWIIKKVRENTFIKKKTADQCIQDGLVIGLEPPPLAPLL